MDTPCSFSLPTLLQNFSGKEKILEEGFPWANLQREKQGANVFWYQPKDHQCVSASGTEELCYVAAVFPSTLWSSHSCTHFKEEDNENYRGCAPKATQLGSGKVKI